MTPTPMLPWQKGSSSGETCLLLFLLRQQNRAEKWAPHFYCPPTPTSRLGKTITRLIRVGSHSLLPSLSEEERALCRGQSRQSLSHERKRGIMPDGSLLFPEGGGELPPYANARNWPRPPPISRHGASQLSFAARETDVAPCITSGKLELPHHQRRYLFYSPLCVLSRVKGSKIDTSVKRVRRLLPTPPLFNRPRTQMCRHWRAGVPQNMHFPL